MCLQRLLFTTSLRRRFPTRHIGPQIVKTATVSNFGYQYEPAALFAGGLLAAGCSRPHDSKIWPASQLRRSRCSKLDSRWCYAGRRNHGPRGVHLGHIRRWVRSLSDCNFGIRPATLLWPRERARWRDLMSPQGRSDSPRGRPNCVGRLTRSLGVWIAGPRHLLH
jgi:hypothetical protein